MFNWLSVIVLLPIEVATGYLFRLSDAIVNSMHLNETLDVNQDLLKTITKPFTTLIIQVSSTAIREIATGEVEAEDATLMKFCCDKVTPAKCCGKTLTKDLGMSEIRQYDNTTRVAACQMVDQCVYEDYEVNQKGLDACMSAWESKNITATYNTLNTLNCTTLADSMTEQDCCSNELTRTSFFGDMARNATSVEQTTLCSTVNSTCFGSDVYRSCMSAWSYGRQVVRQSDMFNCTTWTVTIGQTCNKPCKFLFRDAHVEQGGDLTDEAVGAILLVLSLVLLCICLICIVKLLHSLLQGPMAKLIKKFVNADFPGFCGYFTGYLAILVGAGMTILVQSSSIFTSTLTPLVGMGVITLERVYPLTLGSNIGTTATGILAALAQDVNTIPRSLQVAMCHLFFNISGIAIFYPLPFFRPPIPAAKFLGNTTAKYRWFAIVQEQMRSWSRGERQCSMLLRLLAVMVVYFGQRGVRAACPWNGEGLEAWNDPNSWDGGEMPKKGAAVVIPTGKKILFTESADIESLTIQKGAQFVWANQSDLELRTSYVLVDGEFHMGSDDCRLELPAYISLTGRFDSTVYIGPDDDRTTKVILVRDGATFEVHGKKKTSWTRLAQNVPIIEDLPCASIYNHTDSKVNPFVVARGAGLHVIVWNKDASIFDYGVYRNFSSFKLFFENIPDGNYIAMTAFTKAGLGDRSKIYDISFLDYAIEKILGGTVYEKMKPSKGDSYSLITVKGDPSSTQEYYLENGRVKVDPEENFLQIADNKTNLVYQVATSAKTDVGYFRVMQLSAALPVLELAENVEGWQAGDKIVVASTDFDWRQAEVREIISCPECSASQVRVNASFKYRHFGNFTHHVDERAEVGLLSRNILIQGVTEDECYHTNSKEKLLCEMMFQEDTFGGHIKFVHGFKSVHVQGVELYHMGQQIKMGAYPLHYHMCDEAPGSWLRFVSVHHSFSRCTTIHATDEVEVSDVVCYKHRGHGFFLEDSVEQNNLLKHNLGLWTDYGTLLLSDSSKDWCKKTKDRKSYTINCEEVSTFWITHPNNELIDNAAAGGIGHGYMYVFADVPLGPSFKRQQTLGKVPLYHAKSYPIKKFYKNVAHSYERSGVFFDSYISAGGEGPRDYDVPLNGIVQSESEYDPKDPPGDINGTRVWTRMDRVTAYKNRQNNLWIKGGNINITFASLADAATQSLSGGCTGFQTGTSLEKSVVIGNSENTGMPRTYREVRKDKPDLVMSFNYSFAKTPWTTRMGVSIYQGPMYIKHTFFDRFKTIYWNDNWTSILGKRPVSHAGAISFKRDSTYPTYVSQYTTNLTFGFCDNVDDQHHVFFGDPAYFNFTDFVDTCGPRNAYNFDKDGSLTGTSNTALVRIRPFTSGSECLNRTDWGMAVCPYRYVKVEIRGDDGSLDTNHQDKYPLIARRDDNVEDIFIQKATQRMEYLTRTHKSYIIALNTSLSGARFPTEYRIFGYGVEKQDVVRIGLCVPRLTTNFEVDSDYPVIIRGKNYSTVFSLKELDEDKANNSFYHDIRNGIIYFKIWSLHDRTNDSQLCPAGNCYRVKIKILDGDYKDVRNCSEVNPTPYQDDTPVRPAPTVPKCKTGSAQGLGAIRWDEVTKIVHKDFSVQCRAKPDPPQRDGTYIGCLEEKYNLGFELHQDSQKAMTVKWCIQRCYQRGYRYAGLGKSSECRCSHMTDSTEIEESKCTKTCTGSSEICGGGQWMSVYATGYSG